MPHHPVAILVEQRKDTGDRVRGLALHRVHHRRPKIADSEFKHIQEKVIFALEEVIQAAGIYTCFPHNRGDACGMKALFVKELEGG